MAEPDADQDHSQAQARARELIENSRSLSLSTVNSEGTPLASYAPFWRDPEGRYHILTSDLSAHTANLKLGKADILIIEDEGHSKEIYARERLNFACTCREIARSEDEFDVVVRALGERHGEIVELLCSLSDFRLFQLTPANGVLVLGFGKAYEINARLEISRHITR